MITDLFVTRLYQAELGDRDLLAALAAEALALAQDDLAGQDWSETNAYQGYTSYASLNDLPWRSPSFKALHAALDAHASTFAAALTYDLAGRGLVLDSLWVNVLAPGGVHSGHIHPHAILSGTIYLDVPDGAGAIRFEDPRLPMMMAAPMRRADAPAALKPFHHVQPFAGQILMWESFLRHEVLENQAETARISASFNYRWG